MRRAARLERRARRRERVRSYLAEQPETKVSIVQATVEGKTLDDLAESIVVDKPLPSYPAPLVMRELPSPGRDAQAVLDHFLAGKSKNTLDAYQADLRVLGEHLGTDTRGVVGLLLAATVGQGNALAIRWNAAMLEQKLAPATRARRLGTLRSLTHVMMETGALGWEITARGPKVERLRDTAGPSEDSLHRLFASCGDDTAGRRNRVALALLATMGLRRAEVVSLDVAHYDREQRRLHVLGKGKEQRAWVDVPAEVADAIELWLSSWEYSAPEHPLVRSLVPVCFGAKARRPGSRLSLRGLGHVVQRVGLAAGIRVWPHALRHAAGTLSLAGGHDVLEVQGLLRHASVQTTMRYDDNQKKRGSRAARDLSRRFLGNK